MRAFDLLKAITDKSKMLECPIESLKEREISYGLIGGHAVNALKSIRT